MLDIPAILRIVRKIKFDSDYHHVALAFWRQKGGWVHAM